MVLREAGIETWESCEGGEGHCFPEPTVRFNGNMQEALTAVSAALRAGLNVFQLRRVWRMNAGELEGPWWDITFIPTTDVTG